jgi:hypothetical protein
MTEPKKRTRKAESTEDLDRQIQEMEAELSEQHRNSLPRLIHAAKMKRLEMEKDRRDKDAAVLQEKVETAYAALQEQEERLRTAQEDRDAAHAEWALTLSAKQNADERTRRADKELRELKEEGR